MRLSSGVGAQGSSFTAAGEGFVPGSQVTVTMHSDPVVLGTTTANAAGAWSLKATVPSNAPLGSHTIVASDGVSSLSAPFEVRAAGNNAEKARSVAGVALPRTGTDTAALIALASLLIVIGLGAVTVARRRAIAA